MVGDGPARGSTGHAHPASASITVSEGFDLWIADCEADGLEYGTIKQRKEHKTLHVDPFIGGDKLSALTAPGVYEFDDKLRKAGRSLAMRRKVLTNLKTMLTFCQGKGKVAQNVARGRQDQERRPARRGARPGWR